MSKPKAQDPLAPDRGPLLSPRFIVALLLIVVGIAWIVYYYIVVDPTPPSARGRRRTEVHGRPRRLELPDRLRPGRWSGWSSPPTPRPRWAAAAASSSACSAAS